VAWPWPAPRVYPVSIKIAVVHNAYRHRGGEDVVVDNEIRGLRNAGYAVYDARTEAAGQWASVWKAAQSPFETRFEELLRRERPDVLHVHNLFPTFSPRLFRTAHRIGIRTVLTLHNYRPLCLNGLFRIPSGEICERCAGGQFWHGIVRGCYGGSKILSMGMASHLKIALERDWYGAVDAFIAPSAFLRDKFASYGFSPDRFEVQGHFLPDWPEDSATAAEPYVLFLGRLSEEKGISWLLEEFKHPRLPIQLRIAGDGPLRTIVETASGNDIKYLGPLSGAEKQSALRHATALVMSSECYENFPLAVMEANAAGTPALVSRLGGLTMMVASGLNGESFGLKNENEFWDSLSKLASWGLNQRQRCQEYAREEFSSDRFIKRRSSIYNRILEATSVSR